MKVISAPHRSPLERFAAMFHQDFLFQFPDAQTGGAQILRQLSSAQRQLLTAELATFLADHDGSSERALRRAWMKLGAQHWPLRGSTRSLLSGFLSQLRSLSDV